MNELLQTADVSALRGFLANPSGAPHPCGVRDAQVCPAALGT